VAKSVTSASGLDKAGEHIGLVEGKQQRGVISVEKQYARYTGKNIGFQYFVAFIHYPIAAHKAGNAMSFRLISVASPKALK
jgi:hypothetical protein